MTRSASSSCFSFSIATVLALVSFAAACTSTGTGAHSNAKGDETTSTAPTEPLATNCGVRCEAKLEDECHFPGPADTCFILCGSMRMTEAQATCLEKESCQELGSGDWPCGIGENSTKPTGDPPGSPCGEKNGGVVDCARVGCECVDDTFIYPASICSNGSCAGMAEFCPNACAPRGGWTGR